MQSRTILTKYGTTLVPLFSEIDSLVKTAVREGRNELDEEEVAHVLKISELMIHELEKEFKVE